MCEYKNDKQVKGTASCEGVTCLGLGSENLLASRLPKRCSHAHLPFAFGRVLNVASGSWQFLLNTIRLRITDDGIRSVLRGL